MVNDKQRELSRIFSAADNALLSGQLPDSARLALQLELPGEFVEAALVQWCGALPDRVRLDQRGALPDIPEVLSQSFLRLWHQAVQEAQSTLSLNHQQQNFGDEETRRLSEEALKHSQGIHQELEARYREQGLKLEEARQQAKTLEAEITVLKNNFGVEMGERKREEQRRINAEHELEQLRKQYEDHRRTTESRVKDEQRKSVDAVAKAEVEIRHYRNMLDKIRDEAGKKEAALTRELHELQARFARRDVKVETQAAQIKVLEEEVAIAKQEVSLQHRDLTKLNSDLLAQGNKNKRLESKVKEKEEEILKLNQREISASADAARREKGLRSQLKERDEELMKAQARVTALEKRVVSQDEENRRLNSRI